VENGKVIDKKLRILFITQEDPFYVKVFFEEFFKLYKDKSNILGVVICPTMNKKSLLKLVKQMLDFYGFRDFLIILSRFITLKTAKENLRQLCAHNQIPVYKEKNINGDTFIKHWQNKSIDVIVSVAAPQIFKKNLLDLPKWGCINIHHAKLPHYRGMMPNFWQMYYSEKNAGISVHKINQRIDEGEIILQKEVPLVEQNESLDSLIKRTKRIGAHCIIEALELIRDDRVAYLAYHKENGSYFSFPSKAQVKEFRRMGNRLL